MASRASAPTGTGTWAEVRCISTEPTPSGRTCNGLLVFARSSRAPGSSLWSAKTVPLAKKAAVREWHRPARQRFAHMRHEEAAHALADRRRFRRRALRDVPAGSSSASIW
eukprot:jgi/Tetstr1/456925/TSEL_043595.t1